MRSKRGCAATVSTAASRNVVRPCSSRFGRRKEDAVRFGRIGTQGQSTVQSFPNEAAAAKHAAKLCAQKTGKGYEEVL